MLVNMVLIAVIAAGLGRMVSSALVLVPVKGRMVIGCFVLICPCDTLLLPPWTFAPEKRGTDGEEKRDR